MPDPIIKIRSPQRPHLELMAIRPSAVKYGFILLRPNTASFSINRNDPVFPDLAELLFIGSAVTIERSDGLYPWAGFITRRTASTESPVVLFEMKDHAGTLLDRAHSQLNWGEHARSANKHIQTIFADAERRAVPPLMLDLDLGSDGVIVTYEPRGLSLLDVLRDMADAANWEWEVKSLPTTADTNTRLRWVERLGQDRRNERTLEQGRHVTSAKSTQDISGFLGQVQSVGGIGTLAARPVASGTPDAVRMFEQRANRLGGAAALAGSLIRFEPNLGNPESLARVSDKVLDSPDWVAEGLSFSLAESELDSDYPLNIGDLVTVRFSNIDLGLGLTRTVRLIGLQLADGSGILDVECKVID